MNRHLKSKRCGPFFRARTLLPLNLLLPILLSMTLLPTWVWSSGSPLIADTSLGSDGIGVGIEKAIHNQWGISIRFSSLTFDGDYEAENNDYEADISQHAISTLLNWYPFTNGLKATFGLTSIQGDYILRASGEEAYNIGGETYGGNITLTSSVNISRINPYLGLGWRNRHAKGIGFGFELGAIWLHKLGLQMIASGSATNSTGISVNINASNDFIQDLQEEEQALEEDVKDFIFPWVPVGRVYVDFKF